MFFQTVVLHDSECNRTTIHVGSREQHGSAPCIILTIDRSIVPIAAVLQVLTYSRFCSSPGRSMLRGASGTLVMLRSAFVFVISKFPEVDTVELTDASLLTCSDGVTSFPLCIHSVLLYGKTWYAEFEATVQIAAMH